MKIKNLIFIQSSLNSSTTYFTDFINTYRFSTWSWSRGKVDWNCKADVGNPVNFIKGWSKKRSLGKITTSLHKTKEIEFKKV